MHPYPVIASVIYYVEKPFFVSKKIKLAEFYPFNKLC